jgi:hypothetical protein
LADDSDPAIARVILHGKQPAMIYVPIIRDNGRSRPPGGGANDIRAVMENCEKIADRLYRRYGVRKVLLEGLPETFVEEYNRIPPQRRNVPGDNDAAMIVRRTWNRLLAEKEWLLLSPGDEPGVGPLTALGREFEGRMIAAIENAESSGWLRNQDVYQTNKPRLEAQIKALAEDYDAKHRDLLGKDPGCESEHAITVTRCNRMLLDRLLAGDKPGVLFFDAGHWADLEKQLVARGVPHAVVVPAGVPWPPGEKDPAAIKTEMRQLGASLRKCSIWLGDGGSDHITIPVE